MQRRTLVGFGLFAFLGLCLSGTQCGVSRPADTGGTGTLKVLITDKPFPFEFIEEALITITSVEVRRSGDGDDSDDDTGCVVDADCDDGLPCNGAETCDLATGDCASGDVPVCADMEVCDDFRNGCTALCADDTECADDALCNGDESCDPATGVCLAGAAVECAEGEACDELAGGCAPEPTEPECADDADCDDGLACNGAEACDLAAGACVAGVPVVCADPEVCDELRGGCAAACADDTDCDDGAVCNGDETCDAAAGLCAEGADVACADGEVCDEDAAGCVEDEGDDDDGGSPWVVIFEGEKTFNLIELQGGVTDLLAEMEVPAGTYTQMRLIVTQGEIKIQDVEAPFVLTVPSGAQTGIKLRFTFSVAAGGLTTLLLDVDLSRAFKPIPGGRIDSPEDIREFRFTPSLAMRLINLNNAGSISGTVTTMVDDASVLVEAASVTAYLGGEEITTTSTDENGVYVLSALEAGDYRIEVSASGFEDAEVASVPVADGEDVTGIDVSLTAEAAPPVGP